MTSTLSCIQVLHLKMKNLAKLLESTTVMLYAFTRLSRQNRGTFGSSDRFNVAKFSRPDGKTVSGLETRYDEELESKRKKLGCECAV